jgi:hypothetical protein
MPTEARWFVKTSLVCLLLASVVGTLQFGWGALFPGAPPPWLRFLHLHLGTVGWLINMVFGVALWMFPMPKGATREFRPRYPRGAAVACYFALNLGLALRFVAEPLGSPALGLTCGVLQTLGIGLGALILWPRIRAIIPPVSAAIPRMPGPAGT